MSVKPNAKIIDVYWTKKVNMAIMRCTACGEEWAHRLDRWKAVCPGCLKVSNLGLVREEFASACKRRKEDV